MKVFRWFWLLAFLTVAVPAGAGPLWLVQAASETQGVSAVVSADALGLAADRPVAVTDAAGTTWWADPLDGRFHLLIDAPPMSVTRLQAVDRAAPPEAFLSCRAAAGSETVQTDLGDVTVGADGRIALGSGADAQAFRIKAADLKPVYRGVALVQFKDVRGVNVTVYRTGVVQIEGVNRLEAIDPGTIVQARKAAYGIAQPANGKPLKYPEDWCLVGDSVSRVAVMPGVGTEARVNGDKLDLKGAKPIVLLAPAGDEAAAWSARFRTYAPMVLNADPGGDLSGTLFLGTKAVAVRVKDRNANGEPDFEEDLWMTDADADGRPEIGWAFSASPEPDAGTRLALFALKGVDPDRAELNERPLAQGGAEQAGLAMIGAAEQRAAAASTSSMTKAACFLEDWNRDGLLMRGGLFHGGFLASDRLSKDAADWAYAWDLNADGFCEVFQSKVTQYYFNFMRDFVSLFGLDVDPAGGTVKMRKQTGYDLQKEASLFSKSCVPGRFYQGAPQGFEEHFFIDVPRERFPKRFTNGATFFYYANGGGRINRMTMGRLHGQGGLRAWEIELDPEAASNEDVEWNVVTWRDPWGHELKLNTISVRPDWKGEGLDPVHILRGWHDTVSGVYSSKALYAAFNPGGSQSGSSEGMYGGGLTTQERVEVDEDGATFTVYYSPLMGDLHLKGADFGSYAVPSRTAEFWLDIPRFHHREAHTGPERFPGAPPLLRYRAREAKRLEGPVYLDYADTDRDGYFDSYLYDQENDGLYDRVVRYDASNRVVTVEEAGRLVAWPENVAFKETTYVPENYDKVGDIYRMGLTLPPLVARVSLGSSGIPTIMQTVPFDRENVPPFFVSLDPAWALRAAVGLTDGAGGRNPWTDFGPDGLSRLGTLMTRAGFAQDLRPQPWGEASLAQTDLLILTALARTPDDDEVGALRRWVERGGRLLLDCPDDPAQRIRFNALGKQLGFALGEAPIDKRSPVYRWASLGSINKAGTRAAIHRRAAPWNAAALFGDPEGMGLLDGLKNLSFIGYPLAMLEPAYRPLLTYEGLNLAALGRLGEGRVLVTGIGAFRNRRLGHHEHFEPEVQNDVLIERMLGVLADGLPVAGVEAIDVRPDGATVRVSGRGGPLRFPRRHEARHPDHLKRPNQAWVPEGYALEGVTLDGQPVALTEWRVLHQVDVPPGEHTLEIRYAPATPEN